MPQGCAHYVQGHNRTIWVLLRHGSKSWPIRVVDNVMQYGWSEFCKMHRIGNGYKMILSCERKWIFDTIIFDEDDNQIVYHWSDEPNAYWQHLQPVQDFGFHTAMSSSSSYTNNNSQYNGDEKCGCGRRVVMRTSLTTKNPGRRFLGCINYKQRNGCNFFVWIDPKTCSRGLEYAKIMQAKKEALEGEVEELKMKIESLERGKQIMEEENEALVVKMADLTEANVSLQAQIEVWKTEAKKSRLFRTCLRGKIIVVVVLLSIIVFVIGVLVSSVNHTPKKKTLYLYGY
ncbi:hypothetical protein RHMOL_Rhmol06G0232400 [Rhododendron molle]|uniref:Uncharacterized protein n=1 Tax=Rhododendron molle TaxID=49168 RepID=A0ACC0NG87_RHOML|nr:hypothetical protein RHMOL_Rhmol06G0232400 [Rhododendron molle]